MRTASRPLCSSLAIATALMFPSVLGAQSFQGTGQVVHGTATVASSVTGPPFGNAVGLPNSNSSNDPLPTTRVLIGSSQVVINWTPTDTASGSSPIQFQSAGTLALFTTATGSNLSNFAVLNRIIPSDTGRQIQFNGAIVSSLQGSTNQAAGTVYFYSPGGFVIGPTAAINVGNLGLTTSDPWSGSGNWMNFDQAGNSVVTFRLSNANAAIATLAGSSIITNANGSSYTAIVAPSITHAGSITTGGAAALVAAEAATITFRSSNLFDIQVTSGTSNAAGLNIIGSITGPASTDASTDLQRIYLAAIPKNTALTMLISGGASLGFTPAASATVDGSAIVLSAGRDIVGGVVGNVSSTAQAQANLSLTNATLRNRVVSSTTGLTQLSTSQGSLSFLGDVSLRADDSASVVSSVSGRSITIGGALNINTNRSGTSAGPNPTGGAITLSAANGGSLNVAGLTGLSANAVGASSNSPGTPAGSGTGGTISVQASAGASIALAGGLNANADGQGGAALIAGANGGIGQGGSVSLSATGANSQLSIGTAQAPAALRLSASGVGGSGGNSACPACTGSGGSGTGGEVRVSSNLSGSLITNGAAALYADGTGGSAAFGAGGIGLGGLSAIYAGNAAQLTMTGVISGRADGFGGSSQDGAGGTGTGGRASSTSVAGSAGGATLTFNGELSLAAEGVGGSSLGIGAVGGKGTGGTSEFGWPGETHVVNGALSLGAAAYGGYSANSTGGAGEGGLTYLAKGTVTGLASLLVHAGGGEGLEGGTATGGTANVGATATGGDITVGALFANAGGVGGGSYGSRHGGLGQGGTINLKARDGFKTQILGATTLYSVGSGETEGGSGSAGRGGTILVEALASSILRMDGGLNANADGRGGVTGTTANDGQGGTIIVRTTGNNALVSVGTAQIAAATSLSAQGFGGSGIGILCQSCSNSGGAGLGGTIVVRAAGGSGSQLNLRGAVTLNASGRGGSSNESFGEFSELSGLSAPTGGAMTASLGGGAAGTGGLGDGGTVDIDYRDGAALLVGGNLIAKADGLGGSSLLGSGGAGIGDRVTISNSDGLGGSLTVTGSTELSASGFGGLSQASGGVGGFATGGAVTVRPQSGTMSLAALTGRADAAGGDAGAGLGGAAQAGVVRVTSNGGALASGNLNMSANGTGGSGSTAGGTGRGGTSEYGASAGTATVNGNAVLESRGTGGASASGTGGSGQGFQSNIFAVTGATSTIQGNVTLDSRGFGGNGRIGGSGAGGGTVDPATQVTLNGSAIFAAAGTITIAGLATLDSGGVGGNGLDGAGGPGGSGGSGGSGTAGVSTVFAANRDAGTSTISIGSLMARSDGKGGSGGTGQSGISGTAGGAGGSGTGGLNTITAAAGNGSLTIGTLTMTAFGTGGVGGAGGFGDGQTGGSGGAGGNAIGGSNIAGTQSGSTQALLLANGIAQFGAVSMQSNAAGGNGGAGGGVGTGGGAGGSAAGGSVALQARGSKVNASSVVMQASATGGNGGAVASGSTVGAGGQATAGSLSVLSTERFEGTQSAALKVTGALTGTAVATGGSGSTTGASIGTGRISLLVRKSTAYFGSLSLTLGGSTVIAAAPESFIAVRDGTLTVDGAMAISTPGKLSITSETNGKVVAGSIALAAGDFVADSVQPNPTNPGSYSAGSWSVSTGNNFLASTNIISGSDFLVNAPGRIETYSVNTTGSLDLRAQGGSLLARNLVSGGSIRLRASTNIDLDTMDAGVNIDALASTGFVDVGNVLAKGNAIITAGSFVKAIDLDVDGYLQVFANSSSITGNTILAGGMKFIANGDVLIGNVLTDFAATIQSTTGKVTTGNIDAQYSVSVDAAGNIQLGKIDSKFGDVMLKSQNGKIDGGVINSGERILVSALGNITLTDLTTSANFSEGVGTDIIIDSGAAVSVRDVVSKGGIHIIADGTIATDDLAATNDIVLLAAGNIATASLTAGPGRDIYIANASMSGLGGSIGFFNPGAITTASPVRTGGSITVSGAAVAGSDIRMAAGTGINLTGASAGDIVSLTTGGNLVSTALVSAGDSFTGLADSNIQLANVRAGTVSPSSAAGALYRLILVAGGSVTTGTTDARASATIAAGTDIAIGGITTTRGPLLLLANGNVQTGAITSPITADVLIGGRSMLALGGPIGANFNPLAILQSNLVRTGGSITLGGPVTTRNFDAGAGTSFTAGAITAKTVDVDAGGLATVNGTINAGFTGIRSSDIEITSTGSIVGEYARLNSLNSTATLVGDGLTGSGYALSDAELDRVRTTNGFEIVVDAARGAAPKMTIGTLNYAVAPAGTGGREYLFAVSGSGEGSSSGSVRVDGNVSFTGLSAIDEVSFASRLFELNSATGSVSLSGSGGSLGGSLNIYADRVHVANSVILAKLAANPDYSGKAADLSKPAAVQRPDGVLRARDITVWNPVAVLVQNTGTLAVPAGVVANDGDIVAYGSSGSAGIGAMASPAPVELIINGAILGENGLLTGVAVWDAVTKDVDFTPAMFTATSSINGCLLSATVCAAPRTPAPPIDSPRPDVSFNAGPNIPDKLLPPSDDGDGGEGSKSPITSPEKLVDAQALDKDQIIDEPVAASGNPAMMGGDTGEEEEPCRGSTAKPAEASACQAKDR